MSVTAGSVPVHAPPRNDPRKAALSGFLGSTLSVRSPFGTRLTSDISLSAINGSLAPFHTLQIAEYVDAIRARREPAVTGRDATKSLAILTALYASAKSGRPEPVPSSKENRP